MTSLAHKDQEIAVKARLDDGRIIELLKDCECITHGGPHWLHMDNLDRRRNQELLYRYQEGSELAWYGFAREEELRLKTKLWEMETRHIEEIIR